MGDRHFEIRHPNLEFMLRRGDGYLAGIGHNGGPPLLDMSWTAWIWRKAMARAWAPPPREVALRRLARAERLGLTYRDYTAALLDSGTNLSTALLPLHHLYDGADWHPAVAAGVRRFEGRLLLVLDDATTGQLDVAARKRLLARLKAEFGAAKIDALLVLPFRLHDTDATRALHLRRLLARHHTPRKECFWLGATPAESLLTAAAGLGWFMPVAHWFLAKDTA